MGKKSKQYWFSSLLYELEKTEPIDGESKNLEEHLVDWLKRSHAMLNAASQNGTIEALAYRYADGDTDLTKLSAYSRDQIREALGDEYAPAYKTRRFYDINIKRVQDLLKLQAQNIWITRLIQENPELDDANIAKLFYVEHKDGGKIPAAIPVPTGSYIKRIRARLDKNNGELPAIKPVFNTPKLQLSRADRMGTVKFDEAKEYLIFEASTDKGIVTVRFKLPKGDEFRSGKPCMPDVFVDDDGIIKLQFAIKHNAPQAYEPNGMLGVDVGALYPYTAAIVLPDGTHSQTAYPDEKIMNNVDLINNLLYQKGRLAIKIDQNDRPARAAHTRELAERQKVEKEHLAARVSTVKRRVCQDVAHRVVGMALQHRAGIALEKLNWSSPSHGFYHNLIHDDIINLAHRCGVPVKVVSAAGTSSKCPFDGSVLRQRLRHNPASSVSSHRPVRGKGQKSNPYLTRGAGCDKCGRVFDHDGVSPLNIGARACLDKKKSRRVSRQVFRLRFRNVSLRCFATSAADGTPVAAGPSGSCVSGNPTVATASPSGVADSTATPEHSPDCQVNHESSSEQSRFTR